MKTVRFTEVVKKSGKPEVYLLLSKEDKTFHDALRHDRIMSLLEGDQTKTQFGVIGYEENRRGQLLLFPKSLKAFADTHVVGIKYDLFSETGDPAKPEKEKPNVLSRESAVPRQKTAEEPRSRSKKQNLGPKDEKVILFPKSKLAPARKKLTLIQLTAKARQALRALEKNDSVAAFKVLRNALPD